ncbi:MAG: 1-phosphofructokinase [Candidatus Nanohaloarchaea archaeon]|nr:1-phosphofructokinase [Candidatus Nanohaloarchaea archaeon]
MILTVTYNPAVDQTLRFDQALEPGEEVRTDSQRFDAAGKGVNVTKYLEGLGTESAATGPVGGFTGRFMRSELDEEGVEHDFVDIEDVTRMNTSVLAPEGHYKLDHAGPRLSGDVVDEILNRAERREPEKVVVSGSLPPGLGPEAVDALAGGDWRTVVDLHGDVLGSLDSDYFLCKPNREELEEATGREVGTVEDVVEAASALGDMGFRMVLASLGEEGAVLVTPGERLYAPSLEVEVEDTVGAGDAILAGFLHALEQGLEERDALKYGMAVSGVVVTVQGTGVPDFEDVEGRMSELDVERF